MLTYPKFFFKQNTACISRGIKKLPRKVSWCERDKKTIFRGEVKKEVIIKEEYEFGDYSKMIQLIESDRGEKVIRFTYYLKPRGSDSSKYRYVPRPLVVTQENARELFRKAKDKGFF